MYYALGKARFALQDFTKVLELKPDFTSARMQRATVYLKLAQYVDAKEDYLHVVRQTIIFYDKIYIYNFSYDK